MAPKPKEIDWAKLELFLQAGCTQVNIAKGFGITDDTLNKRVKEHYGMPYSVLSEQMRSTGVMLIEATQLKKALQGNITMLLWLGKVRCGQREPEPIRDETAPHQDSLAIQHRNMILEAEIAELKERLNGKISNKDQSETEQEFQRSDA